LFVVLLEGFDLNGRIVWGIISNVFLAGCILMIFLNSFRAGVFLYFVHYVNQVLPEPLRFVSMFLFPFFLLVAIFWWKFLFPFGVEVHKKYLKKYFGKWEVFYE